MIELSAVRCARLVVGGDAATARPAGAELFSNKIVLFIPTWNASRQRFAAICFPLFSTLEWLDG